MGLTKLTNRIVDIIIASGSGKSDDREVYAYGIEIMLSTVINLLCIFTIAIIVGKIAYTIVYMVFFMGLRTVAGGYHAETHLGCLLVMLAAYGLSLLVFFVPTTYYLWISFVMIVLSASLIFILAPVAHPNKPLDSDDMRRLRALSRSVIALEIALILLGWVVVPHLKVYTMAASMGMVTSALSCGVAVIIKKLRKVSP